MTRTPINYSEFVNSNKLRITLDSRKSFHYDLQVYKDDFRFTLAIPPGQIIEEDFDGLYKRAALYKKLENGAIYEWLCEIHASILDEQDHEADS